MNPRSWRQSIIHAYMQQVSQAGRMTERLKTATLLAERGRVQSSPRWRLKMKEEPCGEKRRAEARNGKE